MGWFWRPGSGSEPARPARRSPGRQARSGAPLLPQPLAHVSERVPADAARVGTHTSRAAGRAVQRLVLHVALLCHLELQSISFTFLAEPLRARPLSAGLRLQAGIKSAGKPVLIPDGVLVTRRIKAVGKLPSDMLTNQPTNQPIMPYTQNWFLL